MTSGQIFRSYTYLFLNVFLSSMYFTFLLTGFLLAIPLMFVLVGFPLLGFMFAASRGLAVFDRQIGAALMDEPTPRFEDDLDLRGMNLGERLAAYTSSSMTWLSITYLFVQFVASLFTVTIGSMLLPFLILEGLLAMIGIHTGMISGRIGYMTAQASRAITNGILPATSEERARVTVPAEKAKNDSRRPISRLADDDEAEGVAYYLTDDGEVVPYREKAKNGTR
ncbi:MAG: sensor domain-containing protein [bacterium]|nr:sensor domain-containing protein [bacterium]